MSQVQPQFDPNHPKYICCCGCHVTTGAKIIASLQTAGIILIALCFIPMIEQVIRQPHSTSALVTFICIFLIITSINGSLWYGLIKEREGFLMPTLICMGIYLILLGICAVLALIYSIAIMFQSFAGGLITLLMCSAYYSCEFALQYWLFNIIQNSYDYFKHKRSSPTGGIIYIPQSQQVYIAVPKENPEP
uniref:DUF7027 domain-containing protein n=1 Tax=Plectus sambesii TaxID=2011161 RepID=A0A914WS71_9BILA